MLYLPHPLCPTYFDIPTESLSLAVVGVNENVCAVVLVAYPKPEMRALIEEW